MTDVTAKVVIYEAFVEGQLEAPKNLARTVHDLYFEPKYEEFRPRTIWSLSNAFTSAFKELGPSSLCPSFFPLNLRNESVALHSERLLAENLPMPRAAYESSYHFFLKYWSIAIGPEPPNTSAARHAR